MLPWWWACHGNEACVLVAVLVAVLVGGFKVHAGLSVKFLLVAVEYRFPYKSGLHVYMLRPDSQPPARFKAGWPVSKPSGQLRSGPAISWPAILPRLCRSIRGFEPVQPGDFEANC